MQQRGKVLRLTTSLSLSQAIFMSGSHQCNVLIWWRSSVLPREAKRNSTRLLTWRAVVSSKGVCWNNLRKPCMTSYWKRALLPYESQLWSPEREWEKATSLDSNSVGRAVQCSDKRIEQSGAMLPVSKDSSSAHTAPDHRKHFEFAPFSTKFTHRKNLQPLHASTY